ncbi:hypothetical protein GWK91_12425 [Virgibacillus sp. MSP4-1]|uniref:hypothetical protein n=1 Tax=Virgibacillus sp. MSP4-1 TaxID=2700081 RepID=UPI00039D5342|nr:hypothetical protein [Virgibacillus sp. MSP4-1]QHS23708.1 hypothetical protein GWK91_12425 [Virgibacillus sp. MSP4-1]
MRFIYSLLILVIFLGGCSSATLLDAIEESGRENTEILFKDNNDDVVIFLSEDYTGQPMLSLNTFSADDSRYEYNSGSGEHSSDIDTSKKFEKIRVTSVGNSSFGALWGAVFLPNAETVNYSLEDGNGDVIYTSSIKISEKNIVYQKLSKDIYNNTKRLHYKILDDQNDVLVEW